LGGNEEKLIHQGFWLIGSLTTSLIPGEPEAEKQEAAQIIFQAIDGLLLQLLQF
jgi:hypothetical protein